MIIYLKVLLPLLFFIVLNYYPTYSRGGRGGGSRGGGSRSGSRGGSRSSGSFRSGTSGKIGVSVRYSTWSSRNGLSSSFRYRSSSYSSKRNGISMGLILASHNHRNTYVYHSDSSLDDISICYNEFPLYGRNISQSPWFVCPWDDLKSQYCCGDEIEERCCRYFDRPGHLSALIIGFLVLIIIITITCRCCCKRHKQQQKASMALVCIDADKINNEGPGNVQFPPYPLPNPEGNVCPPYLQPIDSDVSYPLYPQPNETEAVSTPYPIPNLSEERRPPESSNDAGYLPYSVNPITPMSQLHYSPPKEYNSISYKESDPQYPLIPESPPPSYSDVVKHQNI